MTVIAARDISKTYHQRRVEVHALRGLHLLVDAGELLAITGPSGSGKSTLLHLLGALDTPTNGTIRILDEDVSSLPDDRLAAFRRRHMGFVFQFFNLLQTLSARENVALPLLLDHTPHDLAMARADTLLDRVGLADRRDHRPDELSGGQQQRVALARALVAEPALLLADEPTGNLDSSSSKAILELLDDVRAERKLTIILVTHDDSIAARAPREIRLVDGQIHEDIRRDKANT